MAQDTDDGVAYLRALKQSVKPFAAAPAKSATDPHAETRSVSPIDVADSGERFKGSEKRRSPRYKCDGSAEIREEGCDVRTWATRGPGATIRITMVNAGAQPRRLSLAIAGERFGEAQLERLTAPSIEARDGVQLAGQGFGAHTYTGLLAGRPRISSAVPVHGRYAVALPGDSAALLVLARP